MTSSSRSFALKLAAVPLLTLVLAGCGKDDGKDALEAAKAAYESSDNKKAEKLLARSLEEAPDNVDALVQQTLVKLDLGEIAAARTAVDAAVKLAPKDWDVRLVDARTAYYEKNYMRAAKVYGEIAENRSLPANVRADGWVGLGIVRMSTAAENRDLARLAFLRAIRLDRRNAAAWYHLGLVYRDGFSYNEAALEAFDIFVRIPRTADARVVKVQRTFIQDLKDAIARTATERPGAAKRDSAASAAAIRQAEAAVKAKKNDTARGAYDRALKADPLSYPAALGLAQCWERTVASKRFPHPQLAALENYKIACQLRPSAVRTFLAAADLAVRTGQNATAVSLYSRAVAADYTNVTAIDGLIRALRKAGRGTTALAYQQYRDFLAEKVR